MSISMTDWVRLPGLFRRWEVEGALDMGSEFYIEEAGTASDGTSLFAIYWREPTNSIEEDDHEHE